MTCGLEEHVKMDCKNVVYNAARDGKLNRLKVSYCNSCNSQLSAGNRFLMLYIDSASSSRDYI